MHAERSFLVDLALVLCVAAVTTVVFRKLRQPVVLGYVLAGVIVGPHVPIPLFADAARIHTLSELGVVLVMFSVGLELSLRELVRALPSAGPAGLIQVSAMGWLGYLTGHALGFSARESLFCGAMVAISSTMVVTKVFAEQGVRGKLVEVVLALLLFQDLAAVLVLALLTAVSSGAGVSGGALALGTGRLLAVLLAMVAVGALFVPRAIRFVARLGSPETLLVSSIGLSFAFALAAQQLGYSVALGAFIAGSLVAESGEAERVAALIQPVRDVFAAVFFVSVGMIVDPAVMAHDWPAVLALTAVVLVGQTFSVALGCFLSGTDIRTAIRAGMSLAQVGEFSFIIAGVGTALGAIREDLYPIAVAVSIVTTFTTPWLVRASDPVALWVDRRLPKPLQTFAALYGGWLERLRAGKVDARGPRPGRLVGLVLLDGAAIALLVIGASIYRARLIALAASFGATPALARAGIALVGLLACAPFLAGIVRCARALANVLSAALLPASDDARASALPAPQRALQVTVQLAIVLLVGVPLLALTQPFIGAPYGGLVLLGVLSILSFSFWRSTQTLQDHVRAGAQIIVDALVEQARGPGRPTLEGLQPLLPALGDLIPVKLEGWSAAVGKTLAELDLRGLTGATVVAITRGTQGLPPSATETLAEGDVLALAGTHDAVEAGRKLLLGQA